MDGLAEIICAANSKQGQVDYVELVGLVKTSMARLTSYSLRSDKFNKIKEGEIHLYNKKWLVELHPHESLWWKKRVTAK